MIFLIDGVKKAAKETKASSLFMNPWETQAGLASIGARETQRLASIGARRVLISNSH
ncbi:hypothetical protein LEP1GSC066_3663 [Leptospira sp. serovar Kenya str. Sh9]|nr:hypothetical protein LEP1GSC066_3663 [Leptospira sp. serovar Kenya str. Sh9]EMN11398.1 hypothetical protein LEP1GSC055_2664 [Leptospira borgpetersenii str. Brem 307]